VHAPLMLQAVLGLDAKVIAEAFLVSPATMAQRLVRARAKIRDAGLRFEEPEPSELPERLSAVLDSLYGAYTIGSNTARLGPDAAQPAAVSELTGEALYLCRLVVALQARSAEALGLLALMLYCEARRPAQFDAEGRFVGLTAQDCSLWHRDLLAEAEDALRRAAALRQPGLFQLEAAIQSAHCQRAYTGQTPWPAIAMLYGVLVQQHPAVGARVGQAVALAEAGRLTEGLAVLAALPHAACLDYQPYWVAKAYLARRAAQGEEADAALRRALGLTEDPRVREHLGRQLGEPPRSEPLVAN
jgi:RNA polymerase sigma-70 factor (ECF subfamily)